MDRFSKLVVLLGLLACHHAQATYAWATPPQGWRPGTPASGGYATFVFGSEAGSAGAQPTTGGYMYLDPQNASVHMEPSNQTVSPVDWYTAFADFLIKPAYAQAVPVPPVVVAPTVVNVGGQFVRMPAAMRFASNAARFAAAQCFKPGPTLAAAAAFWLIAIGLEWYWDNDLQKWMRPADGSSQSDGYVYGASANLSGRSLSGYSSWDLLCRAAAVAEEQYYYSLQTSAVWHVTYAGSVASSYSCTGTVTRNGVDWGSMELTRNPSRSGSSCPAGWYQTPAGCLQKAPMQPVTQPEFEDALAPTKIPPGVLPELPDGVPVEDPVINPQPLPYGQPYPRLIPVGDPVKNPDYDPNAEPSTQNQPYKQPITEIKPAPVPKTDPWRVDLTPKDMPVPSPDPAQNPKPNPEPDAQPDPNNPDSNSSPDRQPGLCELYPNILACAGLDTPTGPDLPNKTVDVTVLPNSGWGADNATCPAARHLTVQGRDIPIPYDLFCEFMAGIRPVILAMAWLSAAFIVVGGLKSGD